MPPTGTPATVTAWAIRTGGAAPPPSTGAVPAMTTIIRSRRRITDDRCYLGVRRPPRSNSRERPLSLPEDRPQETEGPPPQRGPSVGPDLKPKPGAAGSAERGYFLRKRGHGGRTWLQTGCTRPPRRSSPRARG